jgi:hypothetical protein
MLEHFIRRGFADEDEQRRLALVQIALSSRIISSSIP